MNRIISYYGAKGRLAKKYPNPIYSTIVEPFSGGASYSLLHYNKNVVLYEINQKVFTVLDYVIRENPESILKIPLLPIGCSVDELDICQEQKWLIGFWINNAVSSPMKTMSKWGIQSKGSINFWGEKCRARIADVSSKIKHWKVYNKSWEDAEILEATWFIDPPYQLKGYAYPNGSKDIDYKKLGEWCKKIPGQVMVCENEGADWLPFEWFSDLVGQKRKEGISRSKEVIWTNIVYNRGAGNPAGLK